MKKTFIKFLPLMAAVLLATSCSKDDDNDVKKQTITSEQTTTDSNTKAKEIPFTLKVSNGKSLNKIAYAKNSETKNIDVSFSESDQGKLQMVLYPAVSVDNQPITSLTLIDYTNGIFSGTINPEDLGTTVQAGIIEEGFQLLYSSNKSLEELMNSIPHVFASQKFTLSEGCEIELTDLYAYFEIIMSPDQHKMDVSTQLSGTTVELSKEGKVWIACLLVDQVDQSNYIETNFYRKNEPQPGNLYTINRAGFVDLGIQGILWADKNIGATESNPYGDYYAWGEVEPKEYYSWATYTKYGDGNGDKEGEQPKFSRYCGLTNYGINEYTDNYESLLKEDDVAYQTSKKVNSIKPWSMPSSSDFENLIDNCDFVWTEVNGVKGFLIYPKNNIKVLGDDVIGGNKVIGGKKVIGNVKGDNADVEITQHDPEKEPHIFLPACGDKDGENVVDYNMNCGSYWAFSFNPLSPKEGDCFGIWNEGETPEYNIGSAYRKYGFKVRAVIDCSEYFDGE